MTLISLAIDLAAAVKMEDLAAAIGHLFHHNPTYSDLDIAQRITEDYNIEQWTLTARFVKRIRLEQGWLRRHNDPAAAEMQEANTIDAIEQLLAEGRIRPIRPSTAHHTPRWQA